MNIRAGEDVVVPRDGQIGHNLHKCLKRWDDRAQMGERLDGEMGSGLKGDAVAAGEVEGVGEKIFCAVMKQMVLQLEDEVVNKVHIVVQAERKVLKQIQPGVVDERLFVLLAECQGVVVFGVEVWCHCWCCCCCCC